jgi:DNA-binding CsgD family transcriptional regulator
MWELANLLYYMGDTERAYRYIVYTAACTTSFGSKQRDSRMAALMADIVVRYRQQSERNNRQLSLALVGTSLLTVLLLVALLFIKRQRGKLHDALKGLAQRNLQMEDAYRNLKDANDKMSDMNTRLNELNNQLGVSNRIKEEYVAHFMALCRLYLDKLDKLRNQMRNLLKQHRFDQLERLANSSEIKNAEYEEFYQQFDEAFLKLFPDFVTDFNRLLRSDEHIEVKQPGHLTPALRIFALVRLGIDDSAQIAEFLNYSVNTIYNYRAQTRNKAAVNRDEFEKLVKQL